MKIPNTTQISGAKPVGSSLPTAQRIDAQKTRETSASGQGAQDAPGTEHPRLDAFAQKIQTRFDDALASRDLSPRQRAALEAQRDRFEGLMQRFEDAYFGAGQSVGRSTLNGLEKLLASFGSSVNDILAGGDAHDEPQPIEGEAHARNPTQVRPGGLNQVG